MRQAKIGGKKQTFRRKCLEGDFQTFCQLSTEVLEASVSARSVREAQEQAANFVFNAEFTSPRADGEILGSVLLSDCRENGTDSPKKRLQLPSHLAGLCEDQLLTPPQERELFRRLNFLKFRAHRILHDKTLAQIGQWDLERAKGLMKAAEWHRDVIVRANLRLVISIVKKFANVQCSFDDLLSDGIMALIRSVDKFDYQLGFRFSTYATQVVRRNSYRFVMDRQSERLKINNSLSDEGVDLVADDAPSSMSEERWNSLQDRLAEYLNALDKREKLIIRARFSLGNHRHTKTLQALADKLHISKERVRQIEKRALEKLQQMAVASPPEWNAAETGV